MADAGEDDEQLIEELVAKKRAIAKRIEHLQRSARAQQDVMLARIEEEDVQLMLQRDQRDQAEKDATRLMKKKWNELLGVCEAHEEEVRLDLWTEEMLEVVLIGLEFRTTQQSSLRQTSWERAARRELARTSGGAALQFAFRREGEQLCYTEERLRDAIDVERDAFIAGRVAESTAFVAAARIRDAERAAAAEAQRLRDEEAARESAALGEIEDAEAALARVQERLAQRAAAIAVPE